MPSNVHDGKIHPIDLTFSNVPGTIAAYCIPHREGAVLVECGPGSTIPALQAGLEKLGLQAANITDVLLTHIHLDHAGAAGWLAQHGARIHVHPIGEIHLSAPEKLLSSAKRIYGDDMETLWGEFLAVPKEKIFTVEDGDRIEIEGLQFRALETPGHASHHLVYIYDDTCFSGDIGGVRLPGPQHLRLPMPPPEFHLQLWRESIHLLQKEYMDGTFKRVAPTHFGIFEDVSWHLGTLAHKLNDVEAWMSANLQSDPEFEQLNERFLGWIAGQSSHDGLQEQHLNAYETANPSWMSTRGIQRYWRKFANPV